MQSPSSTSRHHHHNMSDIAHTAHTGGRRRSGESHRASRAPDANGYLDAIKDQTSAEIYARFLDIMKDFRSQRIDTEEVIERVSRLFHEHPGLIEGFNNFIPRGHRIHPVADTTNTTMAVPVRPSMQA
ncbi:hypothetical protein BJ165DRAFT_462332 [Panaeolus papilionaceus]|nr:hypothetical protein BJ165DRAFT_462332 [Panaeolus papilionaceus]